jgi:hypothetical protein
VKGERVKYDWAYGSFLLCGLAALLGGFMEVIPKDAGTIVLLGYFVAIPLALVSFIALIVGIVLWMRLPKHWALSGLSTISTLFVATLLAGHGSVVISIVYGVGVVAISGLWFLILRRRYVAAPTIPGSTV